VTTNHAVEDYISTDLLALELVHFLDVVCLNDSGGYCGAKHDEIGLENAI